MDVLTAPGAAATAPAVAAASLSVVVPAYNEEAVLPEFHRRLAAVLDALPVRAEIVYVNDGSSDRTRCAARSRCGKPTRASRSSISRAISARKSR